MADLYGDGDYGADAYGGVVEATGYGSDVYGAGVYGGAVQGGPGGALFGPPVPLRKPVPSRVGVTQPVDYEAAVALVLTLL